MVSERAWSCRVTTLPMFCDMWIPEETPCTDKYTKKGIPWPIVTGWDPSELGIYSPPPLSNEGWRLLGVDVESDEQMTVGGKFKKRTIPRCGD